MSKYSPGSERSSFVSTISSISNISLLRQLVLDKERERKSLAHDLDIAARLGLAVSQANEQLTSRVASLENENAQLAHELARANDLANQLGMAHDDPTIALVEQKQYVQRELDIARKELRRYRRELDGLAAQLNDMANEMGESKTKVTAYAKKLSDAEHTLQITQERNTQLQALLDKALSDQKQNQANTTHIIRHVQTDLEKVIGENERLTARITELEVQQTECESQLAIMVEKAKEYAAELDKAHDTIYELRENQMHGSQLNLSTDADFLKRSDASNSDSGLDGFENGSRARGSMLSQEYEREIKREVERQLAMKREIKHKIVTPDSNRHSINLAEQGLKALLIADSELDSIDVASSTSSNSAADKALLSRRGQSPRPLSANLSNSSSTSTTTSTINFDVNSGFRNSGFATSSIMGSGWTSPRRQTFAIDKELPSLHDRLSQPNPPSTVVRTFSSPASPLQFFQRLRGQLDARGTYPSE